MVSGIALIASSAPCWTFEAEQGAVPMSIAWCKGPKLGAYLPTGIEMELNGTDDESILPSCLV